MVVVKAGPAEILRSSQKDEFVVKHIQKRFEEIYLRLAGPRYLIRNKALVQDVGQLIYFACTTLSGLQTLGEEYTGILQVDEKFDNVPSLLSRVTMVVFHIFGERLAEGFLKALESNVESSREMRPEAKAQVLKCIALLRAFLPAVQLLHKGIFYCRWGTYHMSKRLTNVHYVLIRYWLRDRKSLFGFRILGGITLAHLALFSLQTLQDFWKRDAEPPTLTDYEQSAAYPTSPMAPLTSKTCAVCLSKVANPTATLCGHVFCWSCINDWVQNQDRCPHCREIIQRNRLIPLMNYL